MQAYDNDADDNDARDDAVLRMLVEDGFDRSRAAFDELTATLASDQAGGWTHEQLEGHLETNGRELLRLLLQDHLDLRALREQHAVATGRTGPVVDAGGTGHRKVEPGHVRHLATVFGTVRVTRCAWRASGAGNLYPADAALNLPCRLHSHTLRRRAAIEAARGSFGAAQQALTRTCGKVAGKRQVEQLTVAAASDIDAFYTAAVPQPATDDTLLVLSVDGKGVVMRPEALREETRKAAAAKGAGPYRTRLAGGEKQGRKRMATLGVVYDANPAPRRPHDVLAPAITLHADGAGAARRRRGPVATSKWLTGSIATTPQQVISAVFDHAEQRDPTHRRTWVVLVDGARHQLDLIRTEAGRRGVPIHILVDSRPRPRIPLESGLVLLHRRRPGRRAVGRRPRRAHPGRRDRRRHRRAPPAGHPRQSPPPAAWRRRHLHRLPHRQAGAP